MCVFSLACGIQEHVTLELIARNPIKNLNSHRVTIADRVRSLTAVVELLVPYERGDVMASLHREGEVVSTSHEDGGIRVQARLADASRGRLTEFVVVSQ